MMGWTEGWMDGKGHFVTTSTKKAAVSDSVEGWCAAGNLGASRVSIRMDNRMDGQRDDGTDSGEVSFHPDIL
jgi:purine nucleoside permease